MASLEHLLTRLERRWGRYALDNITWYLVGLQGFAFDVDLVLNGSLSFNFAPVARETRVRLVSNWPHPSFNGAFLPNYPVLPTTIPLDKMETDNGVRGRWFRTCSFKSYHPGGVGFVMGDGSVQYVTDGIDFKIYNYLGTRVGGEVAKVP